MALTSGTKLGQYEIVAPLGSGSMGEVYRAHDLRLSRDVAIKVLPELVSTVRDRLVRFETEAKAAAALNHPNILAVYQMGTYKGVPYLVSELLEGMTLGEALRRGPLALRKAIDYGIQVAHGLAAAHEKGIIHRDLKPDNLFVTKEGRIKILDFGLAKVAQPKPSLNNAAPTVTLPGVAVGTVGYMSPEQVRGLETDNRTDIFALGAILYEMVTGKRAFRKATEADTISAILNEEPKPLLELAAQTPIAMERIIRRCLEKNAEQRFHSASDLAFALEALSDPSISLASGAIRIPEPKSHRRTALLLFIGLVGIACIALAYWAFAPQPVSKIANYVQLTHDGQPKSLIGTDGARLFLGLGIGGNSASFSPHSVAQMSVDGGETTNVSLLPSGDMVPLDLSPNGSELLVVNGQGSPPRGPLISFSILGGSPRKIGVSGETAAWSRDGKMLAYTDLGNLYVVRSDGAGSRKLLSVSGDILNVTWSPDASNLRFDSTGASGVGGRMEWEVASDGSDLHRLLEGWHNPPDECCGQWTADGKYFVFESVGQIWALPKGTLFHRHSEPIQLTYSPMSLSSPLPSKDGKKLFLIGQTYRGELTRYDAASHHFAPYLGGISAEYVAFSKDGQWVAYVSYRDGILWRSKLDGSERLQLTYPPMYPVLPRWSPDGKKIAFFEIGVSAEKPARMYEVASDGGGPQLLLPNDHSQQFDPNWSPDGSKLLFAGESNDPASTIHLLDLASGKISDLPGSRGFYSPRWSPDGRFIAAFSGDSKSVFLFDTPTQHWAQLATGSLAWLNWSHDGRYIYFMDFRAKNSVVRVRISDQKVEIVLEVQDFATTGRYGGALALAPDDAPLLLRDTGSQDVYSVDWQEH